MKPDKLKGHLDLLLLEILRVTPGHGYAVITALRERSDGTLDLPEGTVYPALHRLEEQKLLSSHWSEQNGRRRRVYRVTDRGLRALEVQRTQWSEFVEAIEAVLRPTSVAVSPS